MSESQTVSSAVAERERAPEPANAHLGLALRSDQTYWTPKQQAALSVLGIKDASPEVLAVYFHACQRLGLDPFMKQIHLIMRRENVNGNWIPKPTIQVGIDGFRVTRDRVAARTGYECDFEDTVWYDADGKEHIVWLSDEAPVACRVVLIKHGHGQTLRFPGVLRTASYMPLNKDDKPTGQWATQAEHMIEKCCEAFATRRAFPDDLGGVYIEEEMTASEVMAEQRRSQPGAPPTIAGAVDKERKPSRKDLLADTAAIFDSHDVMDSEARVYLASVLAGPDQVPVPVGTVRAGKLTNNQIATVHAQLGELVMRAQEAGKEPRDVLFAIAKGAGWQSPETAAEAASDGA